MATRFTIGGEPPLPCFYKPTAISQEYSLNSKPWSTLDASTLLSWYCKLFPMTSLCYCFLPSLFCSHSLAPSLFPSSLSATIDAQLSPLQGPKMATHSFPWPKFCHPCYRHTKIFSISFRKWPQCFYLNSSVLNFHIFADMKQILRLFSPILS